jgi:hypothetical protein
MKVLLVSEGKHEESGALEWLVRRTLPFPVSCDWDRVNNPAVEIQKGKGNGLFKRAIAWILAAHRRGYDALILVIDEDGYRDRMTTMDSAQSELTVTKQVPRALGVAIRSFDAWMLADEVALSAVLKCTVNAQKLPENNPNPKTTCENLRDQSGIAISMRDCYSHVAQLLDLSQLETRCPKGFALFASRLRALH